MPSQPFLWSLQKTEKRGRIEVLVDNNNAMRLFKSITLAWWQVGIIKVCLLSLGLSAGAYWSGFVYPYINLLLVVFVVSAIYLLVLWSRK